MAALGSRVAGEQMAEIAGRVLRVAATVWIAWVLAGLAWLASGHNSARLQVPPPARRAAPAVDVSQLAALNLFGQPPVATARGEAANAPDTSLQLRLTGVFVNADPERSSAIVAERNNPAPARVYRLNESLPGGATLAEVYDDRILIRRGEGGSEVLRFEKTGGLLEGGASSPAAVAGGNTSTRELLDNALQAMGTAPEQFVQQMGLRPGGPGGGYEVTADTPENIRNAVGLQPGDRIISVNGRRLGDPRRDRDALAALRGGNSAKVEIQRGGQLVTLERKF